MRLRARSSAMVAFVGVEIGAAALWLVLGRRQWFIADEWAFLAARDGGSLHDLLRPHNEHWSTLPILVYRALWHLVGLRSYVPYLVPVIGAHLAAAALLRVVMRRSDVHPWIATAAASAFALFGAGSFNIIYPFQIGFSGALALGLAGLLLADHDDGPSRADAAGLACCTAALLCAGISVVLVGVTVLAVLLRRGPLMALVYALVPGSTFLLWAATAGAGEFERSGSAGDVARFVQRNLASTVDALGGLPWAGVLLVVVLAGGAALTLGTGERDLRRAVLPTCLLVGAVAFALTTGLGRGEGFDRPTGPSSSRYLHVTAALLLPGLAFAASAIAARWRATVVPLVLLFAIGIPPNVRDAVERVDRAAPEYAAYRARLLTIAHLPLTRELPPDLPAELELRSVWVTTGWLVEGAAAGRIPAPGRHPQVDALEVVVDLVLRPVEDGAPPTGCEPLGPEPRALHVGQRLVGRGPVELVMGSTRSAPGGRAERFLLPGYPLHVMLDGVEVGVTRGDLLVCPVAA